MIPAHFPHNAALWVRDSWYGYVVGLVLSREICGKRERFRIAQQGDSDQCALAELFEIDARDGDMTECRLLETRLCAFAPPWSQSPAERRFHRERGLGG